MIQADIKIPDKSFNVLMDIFQTQNLSEIARIMGVTRDTVCKWRKNNKVPERRRFQIVCDPRVSIHYQSYLSRKSK